MIGLYNTMRRLILNGTVPMDVLTMSETFDRDDIQRLLEQPECTQFRVYFGMDGSRNIRAIMVGVDSEGRDILTPGDELIMERGKRCPSDCPPASPLNS